MKLVVTLYNESLKNNWDDFVENSKNGTFMLKRDYMDYHSDRFKECSLFGLNKFEIDVPLILLLLPERSLYHLFPLRGLILINNNFG